MLLVEAYSGAYGFFEIALDRITDIAFELLAAYTAKQYHVAPNRHDSLQKIKSAK